MQRRVNARGAGGPREFPGDGVPDVGGLGACSMPAGREGVDGTLSGGVVKSAGGVTVFPGTLPMFYQFTAPGPYFWSDDVLADLSCFNGRWRVTIYDADMNQGELYYDRAPGDPAGTYTLDAGASNTAAFSTYPPTVSISFP